MQAYEGCAGVRYRASMHRRDDGVGKLREVRELAEIPNTRAALKALATKLAGSGSELRFRYEA